ncbi:MAG: hypothetical protein BEV12_13805 [Microcystis aeruginosa CACIAM 03]|nr:MAG: hypothetical protein BEV12_13805 [Microcystis aeruginosa CACIAM 03]
MRFIFELAMLLNNYLFQIFLKIYSIKLFLKYNTADPKPNAYALKQKQAGKLLNNGLNINC